LNNLTILIKNCFINWFRPIYV